MKTLTLALAALDLQHLAHDVAMDVEVVVSNPRRAARIAHGDVAKALVAQELVFDAPA